MIWVHHWYFRWWLYHPLTQAVHAELVNDCCRFIWESKIVEAMVTAFEKEFTRILFRNQVLLDSMTYYLCYVHELAIESTYQKVRYHVVLQ